MTCKFIEEFALLVRVRRIFDKCCLEGKRPSRDEAEAWLRSLGWQPGPLANLLRTWGYEEPRQKEP
jgi:hypothetical protein